MKQVFALQLSLSIGLLFCASACTKTPDSGSRDSGDSADVTTDCGVVHNGTLENPVSADQGSAVTVTAILGNNLIQVDQAGKDSLVKLQGIAASSNSNDSQRRDDVLNSLGREAILFPASSDCVLNIGTNSDAVIGQLISVKDRQSFGEALIRSGLAVADPADVCGARELAACYDDLQDSGSNDPANQDPNLIDLQDLIDNNGLEIDDHTPIGGGPGPDNSLWKPVSDTTGRPVVPFKECGFTAYLNGRPMLDGGFGNNRCSNFRAAVVCSALPHNSVFKVVEPYSGLTMEYIIPNPCTRYDPLMKPSKVYYAGQEGVGAGRR